MAGVILAAGASSRMGSDKALLTWQGGTFLSRHIDALKPFTDVVLVVAGKNQRVLQPIADAAGAILLVNQEPERGQFSSLRVGLLEVVNRGCEAALVALVDRPPVRAKTVARLRQSCRRAQPSTWAVVPEYGGRHGHPFVALRKMISAFLSAEPSSNARAVEYAHRKYLTYVRVDDRLTIENVDTPADYESLLRGSTVTSPELAAGVTHGAHIDPRQCVPVTSSGRSRSGIPGGGSPA
jgi:molybdenum cofactor cytidylyltransferase